jgi:transglutaminase-like putative cysteine protease
MAFWSALVARPVRTRLATRPSFTLFYLLVGAFLLTIMPHVEQLPAWVTLAVTIAIAVRCILEVYRLPLPSSAFCGVIAVCLFIAVLFQFDTIVGRDAGTAFMAGLLALKFFELRTPREVTLIIFSCFFVVMSALLYSQVLELFIFCLIMMWILTALLLRVHSGDLPQDRLPLMLVRSALIFFQALPLAVILFIFFPRVQQPFQLLLGANPIGLSDTVKPGSIAQLADDDSEVMRVTLNGSNNPSVDSMYWRALVLWKYEAGAWTPGEEAALPEDPSPSIQPTDNILQEITIMAHNQKWLFALDYPIGPAVGISQAGPLNMGWSRTFKGDVLQLSDGVLDHKERYSVTSAARVADQLLSSGDKQNAIELPDAEIDPQVRAFADQLRHDNPKDADYIQAVLHYFRHGHFIYSTDPGAAGPNWLVTFLFKKRKGFCEHFASAFAILMRLEKIPARLVVGYQGGQYNPYRNFYTVKQSNAHAWDEVWFDAAAQPATLKEGDRVGRWTRIDPTAILSSGEDAPMSTSAEEGSEEGLSIEVAHHRFTFLSGSELPDWIRHDILEAQLRRQQVEADWDDLVFSYDPQAQIRLAHSLGLGYRIHTFLLLSCLVAVGVCVIIFQRWSKRKPPVSPVETVYAGFCRSMAQRGIPRAIWEGPMAYTERLAEAFPDKKEAIQDMGVMVARARYGPVPPEPSVPKEMKSLLLAITASQAASSTRERELN